MLLCRHALRHRLWEILILLLVVLLVFGPKRLPEMGRSLGRGMREFKDSISGKDFEDEPGAHARWPPSCLRRRSPCDEAGHESRQRDTVS